MPHRGQYIHARVRRHPHGGRTVVNGTCVEITRIRPIHADLPGRAVTAAMVVNGELWVVSDPSKCDVGWHLCRMLARLTPGLAALLPHLHALS